MAQKKIDKRKFIEGIFNLDVFSRMNISLKDNYNQSKKEIEFLGGKQTELGNSIKIITTQNTKISEEREKRKKIINDNISNYDHQLEKLKEKVSKYKIDDNSDSIKKIDKLKIKKSSENDKIQEFIKESTETVTKIKISKDNLSKIGTDKEECPICLRAITEDDIKHVDERKANISDEIEKLNNHSISLLASLKVLKQNVELIDKGINSLNDNVNKNNLNIQQKKNDEEKISYIEKEVGKEVSLLEDLNKASVEEEKGVDDLIERYKKFDNEILKKKKEFKVLDNVKFVLSEEGVKSYVIKKILTLFNSKISFYLKELNSNAVITFDQYFDEDIKNERGKPIFDIRYCSYYRH